MQVKAKCAGWDSGQMQGSSKNLWTTSLLSFPITLASTVVAEGTVVVLLLPFPLNNQQTLLVQ